MKSNKRQVKGFLIAIFGIAVVGTSCNLGHAVEVCFDNSDGSTTCNDDGTTASAPNNYWDNQTPDPTPAADPACIGYGYYGQCLTGSLTGSGLIDARYDASFATGSSVIVPLPDQLSVHQDQVDGRYGQVLAQLVACALCGGHVESQGGPATLGTCVSNSSGYPLTGCFGHFEKM
jgi:hypothetical protein